MALYHTHHIGNAGEFLAASIIAQIADQVFITSQGIADIVFEYNYQFYRCQVKTKSQHEIHRINWRYDLRRSKSKDRQYPENTIDLYALVSLELRNVIFIKQQTEKQITIQDEHMKNNNAVKNLLDILDNNA
jgi:hypothetical protein